MNYNLSRAAEPLSAEMKRYNIRIDANANVIITDDLATKLKPYADVRECTKELKYIIKQAREEVERKHQAKQSKLF